MAANKVRGVERKEVRIGMLGCGFMGKCHTNAYKKIPYIFINKQNDIGAASGLDVGSAAAAIVKPGKAKETIDDLAKQLAALKA